MSGVAFHKMTGSGNDFVMVDGREEPAERWTPARIAAACDRRAGIGADGLVVLSPAEGGAVRMGYWNADGSRAAMCGNAALCSTRLAARLGLGRAQGMRLLTDAGVVESRCVDDAEPVSSAVNAAGDADDRAEIRLPDAAMPAPVTAAVRAPGEQAMWFGVVGVPHLVVLVGDTARVDLAARGRPLRFEPAFGPAGANANFVAPPREPGGPWRIRTYERGVEGETLACGTGTVAAALALAADCRLTLPAAFLTAGGEVLTVRARLEAGWATDIWLGGQGRLVFSGAWSG
ncbi:MAG TPA: diaminopimelate epimerase [Gemmatimonadales bacterium]|nr:diaminopimelate epimerase [Gemmatimonadales bacterium]